MDLSLNRPYPFVCPQKYYIRRDYYPLSQSLNRKNGFMVVKTEEDAFEVPFASKSKTFNDISKIDKFYQDLKLSPKQLTKPFVPKFVELDKKVLKFKAYFVEPIFESVSEIHRIRLVDIYFYLLDETISVVEPKTSISGLVQGKMFIRQKVPHYDDQIRFIHWRDMKIGQDIKMFARIYTIYDCDQFTKNFYENEGIMLNKAENYPVDAYSNSLPESMNNRIPKYEKPFKIERNEVLTFFAVWDDPLGYDYSRVWRKFFAITFYTNDDTFQIKQISNAYDGLTSIFLSRQKLRKIKHGNNNSQWYSEVDLGIGKWIIVNGRSMLIYDCDKPTRNLLDLSTEPLDLQKYSAGHLPQMQVEEVELLEAEKILLFEATLDTPIDYLKSINSFIIQFDIESQSVTIWEKLENKRNFKGRSFLRKSHLSSLRSENFRVGQKVKIFQWYFNLVAKIDKR